MALRGRGELTTNDVEKLLEDEDAFVRLEALKNLCLSGKPVSDAEAKRILHRVRKSNLGLGGLFGLASELEPSGQTALRNYRRWQTERLDANALKILSANFPLGDDHPYFEEVKRDFEQLSTSLRRNVDDQFEAFISTHLSRNEETIGAEDAHVNAEQAKKESYREPMLRRALDLLAEHSDPSDLGRIRGLLTGAPERWSTGTVSYLRRHGAWDDIEMLAVAASVSSTSGNSLLAMSTYPFREAACRAIYEIGKDRLGDLVSEGFSADVLTRVMLESSREKFAFIKPPIIQSLLMSDRELLRKVVALKVVQSLPKERIEELLGHHLAEETRYYNVITWLDLGVSLPSDKARVAAEAELTKLRRTSG
jgi:hypothetical protein